MGLCLLWSPAVEAYDFMVDGLCYKLNAPGATSVIVVRESDNTPSYPNLSGEVTIPPTVTHDGKTYTVTAIIAKAFEGCSEITGFVFPNTIGLVGVNAFMGTGWYENLPDGVVYVSRVAYKYKGTMPEGSEVVIKDGIETIAEDAFRGCSGLSHLVIGNSVQLIYENAFNNCKDLETASLGNSLISIRQGAFRDCSKLTSITIPDKVRIIGNNAFYKCSSMEFVHIGEGLRSVGREAFVGTNLKKVDISDLYSWCLITFAASGNPLGIAGHLYLNGNEITDLKIPETVTTINYSAFAEGVGFVSLTIPKSVTSIGDAAFIGCNRLKSIYVSWQQPLELSSTSCIFCRIDTNACTLYIPEGAGAYWTKPIWKDFPHISYWNPNGGISLKYDVNGDGIVDVSDVSDIINAILGK